MTKNERIAELESIRAELEAELAETTRERDYQNLAWRTEAAKHETTKTDLAYAQKKIIELEAKVTAWHERWRLFLASSDLYPSQEEIIAIVNDDEMRKLQADRDAWREENGKAVVRFNQRIAELEAENEQLKAELGIAREIIRQFNYDHWGGILDSMEGINDE